MGLLTDFLSVFFFFLKMYENTVMILNRDLEDRIFVAILIQCSGVEHESYNSHLSYLHSSEGCET